MRNIKIVVEYDGSQFKGWQKQKNKNIKTVQGQLEKVLSNILSEEIEVIGSGRTDTDVCAVGQVANFKTNNTTVKLNGIQKGSNSKLKNIRIKEIEEVNLEFNSRFDAKRKTYKYIFNDTETESVLTKNREYFVGKKLDVENMNKAAKHLIGEHDFKAFKSSGSPKKTTVRTIYEISVDKVKQGIFLGEEERVIVSVTGNGFLYNMVRIIAGTLLEVGLGKQEPEYVKRVLESKNRESAGKTVPGKGLTLYKVEY